MLLKHTLIAAAIMICTALATPSITHVENTYPNKPFSTFPMDIGEWSGTRDSFDEKIVEAVGVDDYVLGNYAAPGGKNVQLYVGFYQSQRKGDLIHSPKNCMPGGGWNIIDTSSETLTIPGAEGKRIETIKLILKKGPHHMVVLYWFHSRGRIISSEYMQKIYLVLDSITRHRTDGSFVRLISVADGADLTAATDSLKEFAVAVLPVLNEYLPD